VGPRTDLRTATEDPPSPFNVCFLNSATSCAATCDALAPKRAVTQLARAAISQSE
jgi:hypothetical protein